MLCRPRSHALRPGLDDLSSLLTNTVHGSLEMARGNDGNDRGINNRKMLSTVDHQLVADTATVPLRHHGAGARRVSKSRAQHRLRKQGVVNILIRSVLSTRDSLGDLLAGELRAGPHGTEESQTNRHDHTVNGVDESVVDDVGRTVGVLGVNVDSTAGQRLLNSDEAVAAISRDGELGDGGVSAGEDVGDDGALLGESAGKLLVGLVDAGEVVGGFLAAQTADEAVGVVGHVR
jgi:hypothetical protein